MGMMMGGGGGGNNHNNNIAMGNHNFPNQHSLTGGGISASAYEAARAEHYRK